jgi:oxaloacetate decarboxylase alpha subunit
MSEIRFIDTTVRDGHLSLWALGMRIGHMLGAARQMDRCGFESMEFFGFASIIKQVREHKENPWDWVRLGVKQFSRTRLRYHGGLGSGFEPIPSCVLRLVMERVIAHGITLTRSSNPWNDYGVLAKEIELLGKMGMDVVANIIYSVSPKHTNEYYVQKARELASLRPYRICFKDVSGLLTPERSREMLQLVMANIGDIPLEFHAHCNNSLAPLNYVEALKLGVKTLHTAIPPLANGSSQPSIFNVAANAEALGLTPRVDLEAVRPVEKHFTRVALQENFPIGAPREYDYTQYRHQVPGGMISNLRYQLETVGMGNRLEETLEEAGHVREEYGYPIMVTPLAQFVGTQAAVNVMTGERYKEVTDQSIQYALGHWGEEGARLMDENVRDKILSRPRAREWAGWTRPEPSLDEVRRKFGGHGISDEELVLRVIAGTDSVTTMLEAGAPKPFLDAHHPVAELLTRIAEVRKFHQVHIHRRDLSLRLEQRGK